MLVNGVCTAVSLAFCATLTPATPVPLLLALLAIHGAFRSLEFTCMGTLAYTDIPPASMTRVNGFLSAIMQLGMGMGVPVAAISVRLFARAHGDSVGNPALRDFRLAILVAALLALGPVINSLSLPADAGAAASGHCPPPAPNGRII